MTSAAAPLLSLVKVELCAKSILTASLATVVMMIVVLRGVSASTIRRRRSVSAVPMSSFVPGATHASRSNSAESHAKTAKSVLASARKEYASAAKTSRARTTFTATAKSVSRSLMPKRLATTTSNVNPATARTTSAVASQMMRSNAPLVNTVWRTGPKKSQARACVPRRRTGGNSATMTMSATRGNAERLETRSGASAKSTQTAPTRVDSRVKEARALA
mmetsp:Transcript_18701/g.33155  ORF Transcript_18701/g.33155 Transcript_18701/m.33155 type:complete len:219 (-) Transcript_18701:1113-1769(-)